jgi:hypothetical protein
MKIRPKDTVGIQFTGDNTSEMIKFANDHSNITGRIQTGFISGKPKLFLGHYDYLNKVSNGCSVIHEGDWVVIIHRDQHNFLKAEDFMVFTDEEFKNKFDIIK